MDTDLRRYALLLGTRKRPKGTGMEQPSTWYRGKVQEKTETTSRIDMRSHNSRSLTSLLVGRKSSLKTADLAGPNDIVFFQLIDDEEGAGRTLLTRFFSVRLGKDRVKQRLQWEYFTDGSLMIEQAMQEMWVLSNDESSCDCIRCMGIVTSNGRTRSYASGLNMRRNHAETKHLVKKVHSLHGLNMRRCLLLLSEQ